MNERILIIILIVCLLMFLINYCNSDVRIARLEALIKCLESETVALRRKIASYENEKGDNE